MISVSSGAAGIGVANAAETVTVESMLSYFESKDASQVLSDAAVYFESHKPTMNIVMHMEVPRTINQVVMGVMPVAPTKDTPKDVVELLADKASTAVMGQMPKSWDEVMKAVDSARQHNIFDAVDAGLSGKLANLYGMSSRILQAMRSQLFFYIVKVVGTMQYIRMPTVSAAASAPMQYLPLYCQRTVDEPGKEFDIAAVGLESFDKKPAWLEKVIKTTTCPTAVGGLDHATAMVQWLLELYDCHEFIARHDGAAFSVKRDLFFVAIRNLSADGLKQMLASEGVTIKTVITRQIDLFASSKSAVIADIEAAYLILHKDAAEAALIYQQSSEIVEKRMLEKYEHRLANGTATNQSVSISNLSTSAPTLEIPAGTPIAHWWLNILRHESTSCSSRPSLRRRLGACQKLC